VEPTDWRWRAYIKKYLRRLGHEREPDILIIITSVIGLLSKDGFDIHSAERNLELRKFRGTKEQRQTTDAVRTFLHLGRKDGEYRRQARMELLSDRDASIEDIRADDVLGIVLEEEIAGLMVVIEGLPERDRKILKMKGLEEASFREVAAAMDMPVATVHKRFVELLAILAYQLSLRGIKQ
jgi:DNA-directed RNA polymerase specialized sigma24 family protein